MTAPSFLSAGLRTSVYYLAGQTGLEGFCAPGLSCGAWIDGRKATVGTTQQREVFVKYAGTLRFADGAVGGG
jgi:hypothetical protein